GRQGGTGRGARRGHPAGDPGGDGADPPTAGAAARHCRDRPPPGLQLAPFPFPGTAAPGPPRAGVEGELRWFTPAELEAAPIPEVDRRLLPWLLGPADGVPRLGTIEYGAQGELKHLQLEPPGRKAGPAAEENL